MARRRVGLAIVLVLTGTFSVASDAGRLQVGKYPDRILGSEDRASQAPSVVGTESPQSAAATSDPIRVEVNYYDVEGAGIAALWQSMRARGPRADGQPWAGHARWEVRWTYQWREAHGGCRVDRVATELSIAYTLPRWTGRDAADPDMRSKWDRFSDNLRAHEEGHGRHGRQAAARIREALANLSPVPDCQSLMRSADERARQIVDEEAANDRAYDSATRHGLAQGVALN